MTVHADRPEPRGTFSVAPPMQPYDERAAWYDEPLPTVVCVKIGDHWVREDDEFGKALARSVAMLGGRK